ncbi:MAG TPA: PAS domain-containing protein [Aestuariivirga sp.]
MQVHNRNEIESASAHISHAGSRALFRHWEALRAERPCPDRTEIKFADLANVISNLAILDRNADGKWQYRLAGGAVCAMLGENVTGQQVLAQFDSFESQVIARVLNISEERLQPGLMRMRLVDENESATVAELLILPVLNTATGKPQLICGLFELARNSIEETKGKVQIELFSARLIWTEHLAGTPADVAIELGKTVGNLRLRVIQGGLSR